LRKKKKKKRTYAELTPYNFFFFLKKGSSYGHSQGIAAQPPQWARGGWPLNFLLSFLILKIKN